MTDWQDRDIEMQEVPPILYTEIMALISRLYRALDAGHADLALTCFADGATWHRHDGLRTGSDAIRAIVTDRPADRKTSHIPSNLMVSRRGDLIVGQYYLTVYGAATGVPAHLVCCWDCEDIYVETDDGLRVREKRTSMRMKFA